MRAQLDEGRQPLTSSAVPRWRSRAGPWLVGLTAAALAGAMIGALGPAAALGAVVLGAGTLAVIRWPGLTFAAYLLLPFYKGYLDPYVPGDLTVILAVANGLQAIWITAGGWRYVRREPLIAWLALTLVIVAGAVYAPNPDEALSRVIQWLALIVFPSFAALRIVSERRHVRQFVGAIFVFSMLVVALALPRLAGPERLVVLAQNTIQVAIAALLAPMIALAYIRFKSRVMELALLVLVPVSLIVAIASGSRGPPLAAAGVVLVALGVHLARGGRIERRATVMAAMGGVGMVTVFVGLGGVPEASAFRYGSLLELVPGTGATADSSLGVRMDLFGAALALFAERPIFGHGTGGFASYATGTVGFTDLPYPHNSLLQVAADLGVVGVGMVGVLVAAALFRTVPPDPSWTAVRMLFGFLSLQSLVSGDLYGDRMLWGLLALLLLAPGAIPRGSAGRQT